MDTNKVDKPAAGDAASAPTKGSPVRLLVLLGVLGVVLAALAYDQLMAKPAVEAADKRIHEFVDARNRLGVKDSALVTSADIQKELGGPPTRVEDHPEQGYTVEYYCWWGPVPYINERRHFIAVVYLGKEPRHYSSHYREQPPQEAFPILDATDAADEKAEPISSPKGSITGEGTAADKTEDKAAEKPAEGKADEKGADKPAEGKSEAKPADESGKKTGEGAPKN